MGREIRQGQNHRPLLRLTQRRNQCPGGTGYDHPRIHQGFRPPGRMERLGQGQLPHGSQIMCGQTRAFLPGGGLPPR
jgi:hypothetical protein